MLDTFVSIGDTLKEIRETKGFHLQEVAQKTAINYTILSRIETGKRSHKYKTWQLFTITAKKN